MERKAVYNIAFGFNEKPQERRFIEDMRQNFQRFNKFEVAKLDILHSIEEIEAAVKANAYDVIVTSENLGARNIGSGSAKKWIEIQPELKIMFIIGSDRKGGNKLAGLFKSGYYDSIYQPDFKTGEIIADLIVKGRTKEEAFNYYGLENNEEFKEQMKKAEAQQEDQDDIREPAGVEDMLETQNAYSFEEEEIEEEPIKNDGYEESEPVPVQRTLQEQSRTVKRTLSAEIQEEKNMYNANNYYNKVNNNQVNAGYPEGNLPSGPSPMNFAVSTGLKTFDLKESSVASSSGYVVSVLTDTALVIEVPNAHFMENAVPGMPVNLITPGMSL